MKRKSPDLVQALLIALFGHGVLGLLISKIPPPEPVPIFAEVEITFEEERATEPEPLPEPEPEPEPLPEPEPEPLPVPVPVRVPQPETRVNPPTTPSTKAPPPDQPIPSWATDEPAPGPADSTLPGGQVYDLASLSPGGAVPVAVGSSSKPGPGGSGSGSGGGGDADSKGTGPAPVSIAMIKTRPLPIGDTDFLDISKNYPEAAKLNAIEGSVKVKILVTTEGKATRPRLVTKLGYGLDALALRLAKKLRFEPALDTNNRAVPATVVWTFQFTLPK